MYLPLFLCLYESFWKGFESDQTETVNIAGYQMRLLVWPLVNKTFKSRLTFLILLTIKGQMNQKIDIFSFVAFPSPNTKKNHPK